MTDIEKRQVAALNAFCAQRSSNKKEGLEKFWGPDGTLTDPYNANKIYRGHEEIKEYYKIATLSRGTYSEPKRVDDNNYTFQINVVLGITLKVDVCFFENDFYFKSLKTESIGYIDPKYFMWETFAGKD